ncbi:MAG: hypothetical protein INR73_09220 [Williamsia sp.]|nr:hypothetical protein [Williamsia sp.]
MKIIRIFFIPLLATIGLISCSKNSSQNPSVDPAIPPPANSFQLRYSDSVFYINNQKDYTVSPVEKRTGTYFSFPEGLSLDKKTGEINVSKSDAGLKYRVSFAESGSKDTVSTFILVSGINYYDGFYVLSKGDSILKPVYNANKAALIPGINNGTVFDVGSSCNDQGCKVSPVNAEINLAQTVRNGVFGNKPSNNARQEFEMTYRINDNSGKVDNKLKVKLYYYDSMSDVTQEAFDIINSRTGAIIGPSNVTSAPLSSAAAKPRPPCIFIVSH